MRTLILVLMLFYMLPWAAVRASTLEALPRLPPIPADNPQSPAKVELGKELFFDPRISKTGRTSCFSCHNVFAGGEDGLPFNLTPAGHPTHRSVPSVWNAAYLSTQFWTGSAASLEEQALGPLEEMGPCNLIRTHERKSRFSCPPRASPGVLRAHAHHAGQPI